MQRWPRCGVCASWSDRSVTAVGRLYDAGTVVKDEQGVRQEPGHDPRERLARSGTLGRRRRGRSAWPDRAVSRSSAPMTSSRDSPAASRPARTRRGISTSYATSGAGSPRRRRADRVPRRVRRAARDRRRRAAAASRDRSADPDRRQRVRRDPRSSTPTRQRPRRRRVHRRHRRDDRADRSRHRPACRAAAWRTPRPAPTRCDLTRNCAGRRCRARHARSPPRQDRRCRSTGRRGSR